LLRILHLPKWYPHRYDDQDGDFVARHVATIAAQPGLTSAVVFAVVAQGPLPRVAVCDVDLRGPVPTWRYYYRAHLTGLGLLDRLLKLLLWLGCTLHGLRAVRRHWQGQLPSLLHAHVLLRTGLLAWALRGLRGLPYVVTEHWTIYLPERRALLPGWRRWLTGVVVRRAAALHTVSRALAEALRMLGARAPHTAVIANVVDLKLFWPGPAAEVQPATLLHVSAFHDSVKNLSGVLRVVATLRPAWPGLCLRVAGYGPDEAYLHHYATELELLANGAVQWLGKLPHSAVAAEMRQATALVSFSRAETFGCVLLEARASGRPVVATQVGGVPELFEPAQAFGLLVPPDDEAALAAAITSVLAAPAAFAATRLHADAAARCGAAAVGMAFERLYQQVLISA
jgi:starch synthase